MNKAFYNKMLKKALGLTKNLEDAEDAVQTVALKLMHKKDIKYLGTYFSTAVYNQCFQLIKDRKKLYIVKPEAMHTDEHKDVFAREVLLKGLAILPKGQLKVIKHVLADEKLADLPGKYDTNKAHYFLAVKRLREVFDKVG